MVSKKLDRRTFLRGAAGTALALPALECMLDVFGRPVTAEESPGAASPKRYFVTFAGMSIGAHEDQPNDGIAATKTFIPTREGRDYDVSTGLAPLGATIARPDGTMKTLKDYVSVVSNLIIPTPGDTGASGVPPAGRPNDFHKRQLSPLLTARRYDPGDRNGQAKYYSGTSSDQIVAEEFNEARTMIYRAQYRYYSNGNPDAEGLPRTTLSTRMEDGRLRQLLPTINPAQAYMDLFGMDNDPTQSRVNPRRKLLQEARKGSVLDLVNDSYTKLRSRVGSGDRERLERHTSELRELEKRLEAFEESTQCTRPMEPERGWDPDAWEPWANQSISSDGSRANWAWNDETTRGELLADIIYHGFKCGISNVATLCLTLQQSFMSCQQLCGLAASIHGTGHQAGNAEQVEQVVAWHVELWGRVLKKLGETPEYPGSGETMLDNTAAVLLFEGGYGENFEKPDSSSYHFWSTHSTQNMALLIGGGAGGLNGNVHIRTNQDHPATVLMSAMEAVGVRRDRFGDLDWKVQDGLFG